MARTITFVALYSLLLSAVLATICEYCSTTGITSAVAYKTNWRKTVDAGTSVSYALYSSSVTYVVKGTQTQLRPRMTTTVIVSTTVTSYTLQTYTQTDPTIIHTNATLTQSVCSRTKTPSDYPQSPSCDCKRTTTSTTVLPISTSLTATIYTYNKTVTGPPTSYGATVTSTITYQQISIYPTVVYPSTRTIYQATQTTTLAPYETPPNLTFKLMIVDNTYLDTFTRRYIAETYLCFGDSPPCGYKIYGVFADIYQWSATVWRLDSNGTLYDTSDNATCTFHEYSNPHYNSPEGYYMECVNQTYDNYDFPTQNMEIDCFGHLVSYIGNSATWATLSDYFLLGIVPRPPFDYAQASLEQDTEAYDETTAIYLDLLVVPQ